MNIRTILRQCVLVSVLAGCVVSLDGRPAFAAEPKGPTCGDCHEKTVKSFAASIHGKTGFYGEQGGCVSCHRGAAEHADSGDPSQVVNLGKLPAEAAADVCLGCHGEDKSQLFWRGSTHENEDVGCTACHRLHGNQSRLLGKADQKEVCFACHPDVRADILKRSKHPLRDFSTPSGEGKMTCSSCHNPHGAPADALIAARSVNDKCYECHFEKKAPVLWEHSPVKEDCLICHKPHGSSNDKLLVTRVPRLCQECHMQGRHQSGALAERSVLTLSRSCLNCHAQVHGSNNPSGAVLQR